MPGGSYSASALLLIPVLEIVFACPTFNLIERRWDGDLNFMGKLHVLFIACVAGVEMGAIAANACWAHHSS